MAANTRVYMRMKVLVSTNQTRMLVFSRTPGLMCLGTHTAGETETKWIINEHNLHCSQRVRAEEAAKPIHLEDVRRKHDFLPFFVMDVSRTHEQNLKIESSPCSQVHGPDYLRHQSYFT